MGMTFDSVEMQNVSLRCSEMEWVSFKNKTCPSRESNFLNEKSSTQNSKVCSMGWNFHVRHLENTFLNGLKAQTNACPPPQEDVRMGNVIESGQVAFRTVFMHTKSIGLQWLEIFHIRKNSPSPHDTAHAHTVAIGYGSVDYSPVLFWMGLHGSKQF